MESNYCDKQALEKLIELLNNNLNIMIINGSNVWSNTGWAIEEYFISSFEFYYLIEGSIDLTINGSKFTYHKGDMFFVDNSQKNSCSNGAFTIFGLNFSIEKYNEAYKDIYESLRRVYSQLQFKSLKVHIDILRNYYTGIARELIVREKNYESNIKHMLMLMLIRIQRVLESHSKGEMPYRYIKYSDMVSDIIAFLYENLHRNVTLAEIGQKYNLNYRYVNRIFKRTTGFPVIQYQQQLKVEGAKRLLATSSMNLLDIALELNFGSSQYLNYIFKKVTGMTPAEYRRKAR